MHKAFADWYRAASVAPPLEVLEQRWAGVEQLTKQLTRAELTELVRLFSVLPNAGYETPEFMDVAFRQHDSAFPTRGHMQELRVLAGVVLRTAIDEQNDSAVAAAYGLVSGSFHSRAAHVPNKEHIEAANKFLVQRASAIRDIELSKYGRREIRTREQLDAQLAAQLFGQTQIGNLRGPLLAVLADQSDLLNALQQSTIDLRLLVQAQREELNLLWWLQNEFSRELAQPFSALGAAATCVLPLELTDLLVFTPGPSAVLGMLISVLSKAKSGEFSSIKSAINASPRSWREAQVAKSDGCLGSVSPVSFAISKSLETDGPDEWIPAYRKQCDVSAEESISSIELAHQLYSERMFIRALYGINK